MVFGEGSGGWGEDIDGGVGRGGWRGSDGNEKGLAGMYVT